ncbi:MAG: MBL fold metallo-hydrolase [Candidatus Lokiarchaeota archaeon]|nr:MBL fold metallo-hydrolase [Candidatus Lokiarchaeota archaeon]
MATQEIDDNVFFLQGRNNGAYPFSNSLLILGENSNVLIDAGIGKREIRKISKKYDIDTVLISHCHEDHILCLKYILENTKVYIHVLDKEGVERIGYLQRIYGLGDSKYNDLFNSFMLSLGYKEIKVRNVLKGGEIFDLGDVKVKVIHTPGHSAGHCCFLIEPYNIIFLADIDLTSLGPWYGSIDGNIVDFKNSIKKILGYDIKIAISSHKGIFKTNIKNNIKKYLDKFKERDRKILNQLKEKQTIDDLTKKALIYGKFPEPEEFYIIAERLMIEKHLKNLLQNKKIKRENGYYYV